MKRPSETASMAEFALYVWELEEQNKRLRRALERFVSLVKDGEDSLKWYTSTITPKQIELDIAFAGKVLKESK